MVYRFLLSLLVVFVSIACLPALTHVSCLKATSINCSRTQETPAIIPSLSGKNVVFIAAGGSHSAAVTEGGALYTWGKGSFGRLGHGGCFCRGSSNVLWGCMNFTEGEGGMVRVYAGGQAMFYGDV